MHGKAAYVSIYRPIGAPHETGWAEFAIQPYSHPEEARANADLITEAPELARLLHQVTQVIDMTDPEHEDFADSGADTVQALCELEVDIRTCLARVGELPA